MTPLGVSHLGTMHLSGSASYNTVVLEDGPELFWDLDDVGTTILDSSGNGNHGKRYTNQVVSAAGFAATGFWNSGVDSGKQDYMLPAWSGEPPVHNGLKGTGYRADAYAPYTAGSQLAFEAVLLKIDPYSFATIFSGSGSGPGATPNDSPHPTWEMGRRYSGAPDTVPQMMRFYPRVSSFPLGWVDWGTDNTRHPNSGFYMGRYTHIICQYDDAAGIAEYFVNGHSQGQQGPVGYGGVPLEYHDNIGGLSAGTFQIGWRGNYATPNSETYGGFIDKVAVYERLLTPQEVWNHWWATGLASLPQYAYSNTEGTEYATANDPEATGSMVSIAYGVEAGKVTGVRTANDAPSGIVVP